MLQVNDAMRLLTGLGTIGQQLCQDCLRAASESLHDPENGVELAYREQLRATRTAVDELLSLESRCIEEWRSQLPANDTLSFTPRALLDATDAAIRTRTELWHAWFASAELMAPKGLMAPLMPVAGDFPLAEGEAQAAPTGSAQRKTGRTPRSEVATAEGAAEGSAGAR